jgi:hypothetical protein
MRMLPPRDPRQDLHPEVVEAGESVLEALGAEPPQALTEEVTAWFERYIRPLLPRWAAYAARLRRWQEREIAAHRARNRRDVIRRLGGCPKIEPAFSAAALRAFERLGLGGEEEAWA